ncbi:MAG TPA: hypothetical protein VJC16_01585 [Candidatus Nanoarchaeia archaeon]|nr:hypothetical protein [Candidatus Nanoarchaeia archaeon]
MISKLIVVLLIIGVVILAGCGNQPASVSTCDTADCFVKAANTCSPSVFTSTEAFGVVEFSSASDCTFTKKMVSIASETPAIKSTLDGKSMVCTYERGAFNPKWLRYLILGAEKCDGELKERLGELLPVYVAQTYNTAEK